MKLPGPWGGEHIEGVRQEAEAVWFRHGMMRLNREKPNLEGRGQRGQR